MDNKNLGNEALEQQLFDKWASYQTQILGYAQGGVVHPRNAQTFIKRLLEAEPSRRVKFIENPLHRQEVRIALRFLGEPEVTFRSLKEKVTDNDRCIFFEHNGEIVVVELNNYGVGYCVHTDAFNVSYYVSNGLLPNLSEDRLRTFAEISKLCKEVGYAHL